MASILRPFRILLSSPSDVAEEKRLAAEVVEEWNREWRDFLGVQLIAIRYESDAYSMTADYAQAAVNDIFGDDYDLFAGIMWKRLGTATPSADSGTVEEFDRAMARFKADPNSVQIMFLFRLITEADRRDEPGEIARVEEFQRRIGFGPPAGYPAVLLWPYTQATDFSGVFRFHLIRHVQRWIGAHPEILAQLGERSKATQQKKFDAAAASLNQATAQGRQGAEHLDDVTATVNEMTTVMRTFRNDIVARSDEARQATTIAGLNEAMERFGADFRRYTWEMDVLLARFTGASAAALDAMSHQAALALLLSVNPTPEYREALGQALESLAKKLVSFQDKTEKAAQGVFSLLETMPPVGRFFWAVSPSYATPAVDGMRITSALVAALLQAREGIGGAARLFSDIRRGLLQ